MFVFFVAVTAFVFSLAAVALDFFSGIVLPMQKFPRFRNKKILISTIWITSMCLMTPWLITTKVKNSRIEFKFTQFGEIDTSSFERYLSLHRSHHLLVAPSYHVHSRWTRLSHTAQAQTAGHCHQQSRNNSGPR